MGLPVVFKDSPGLVGVRMIGEDVGAGVDGDKVGLSVGVDKRQGVVGV